MLDNLQVVNFNRECILKILQALRKVEKLIDNFKKKLSDVKGRYQRMQK